MILGFLGKGGSGKSTLATSVAQFLHAQGKNILAIDADYNMDLSHNLSTPLDMCFLGDTARAKVKSFFNMPDTTPYRDVVLEAEAQTRFSLSPIDSFTEYYSAEVSPGMRVMAVGPQTMSILTDTACSHSLGGSLKVFLPLLKLNEAEVVIVDEKAGVDSVGTGVPTGFNLAVIVVEPTVYGIKTGKQIATALEHYHVPYVYVVNKVKSDTDTVSVERELEGMVISRIPFTETVSEEYIKPIIQYAQEYIERHGDLRYEQSIAKFNFNKEYNS